MTEVPGSNIKDLNFSHSTRQKQSRLLQKESSAESHKRLMKKLTKHQGINLQ